MKHLYTFALAAAVAMTASAQRTAVTSIQKTSNKAAETTVLAPVNTMKAARAAVTMNDLVGEKELTCGRMLSNMSSTYTVNIAATGANTITIEFPSYASIFNFKIPATVDLTAGTVTIANMIDLGVDKYGDKVLFYIKDWNAAGDDITDGASSKTATVGTIVNGNLVFPEDDIWALGDPNDEGAGWWWLAYDVNIALTAEEEPEVEGTWVSAGKATFIDGWCLPGIVNQSTGEPYDQNKYPWIVDVESDQDTPGRYRVVNPYIADNCPVAEGNSEGYIVFNISDPEYVLVETGIYSGLNNGTQKLNVFNLEGFYADKGYDKETVMNALEWSAEDCSSYADGRVSVKNCRFNMKGALDKAYSWQYTNADGQAVSCAPLMKAEILFDEVPSGIQSVVTDQNAPAEYFNLQGIRVSNPENGIYIRRQGNQTMKVRF